MSRHQTTRRAVGASLAAAPVAGLSLASPADIDALIESHRSALADFDAAHRELKAIHDSWRASQKDDDFGVPSFLGGSLGSRNGRKRCREQISAGYESMRRGLVSIERIAPDIAAQTRTVLDSKEVANLALVDELFDESEKRDAARRDAFGLTAAEQRFDAFSEAERDAAIALCAYRCKTSEEERRRALYILDCEAIKSDDEGWFFEAILRTLAGEAANSATRAKRIATSNTAGI